MKLPADMSLWEWVKQRFTPLATPAPYRVEKPVTEPVRATLDLHGLTVQAAYERSLAFVASSRAAGRKSCTIITGRSGQICKEFPEWMYHGAAARRVEEMNGGGAFTVFL